LAVGSVLNRSQLVVPIADHQLTNHLLRREVGPEGRVRAGVLDENAAGLERLVAEGWTEVWSGARMIEASRCACAAEVDRAVGSF